MICKKAMKIAMDVGMVLCATASFAKVTENFEGTIDAGWSDGTADAVVEDNSQYGGEVGYPISGSHTKILNLEGEVSYTNSPEGTPTSSISDFLIFIPEPSDELDGEDLGNAKVAIAAGTNWVDQAKTQVKLCLYCKEGESAAAWHEIAEVTTSTWLRVTLVFKDNRCRVSLDGEPVVKTFGYAASSGDAAGGPWYNLASTGNNSVQSLSFIGCAKLDDVVIKDAFEEIIFPADVSPKMANMPGETVNYNDLNKWGVTSDELNKNYNQVYPNGNTSGMTVAQKLECGLDPTSDTKFGPTNVVGKAANIATIKFPCDDPSKTYRYSVAAQGATATLGEVKVENGTATADVTFSGASGKVITFWLEADRAKAKPNN